MCEPAFWYAPQGWQSALLAPAAMLYGAIAGRRMQTIGARADVPVICVGNFHMGGAGKTQVARVIADMLRANGRTPFFLSRGYGGDLAGPVRVDPAIHDSRAVGDEPLLLARDGPTIVARDRAAGARLAAREGADVIVMDDGFQNPALIKDLSVIVVDARRGIGNARVFPAGPLRAPLELQWQRTDALVVIGQGAAAASLIAEANRRGTPTFQADIEPDASTLARLSGRPVFAFAGIGDPERFRRTLIAAGLEVAGARWFADHHAYRADDVSAIIAAARRAGAIAVTTQKDAVRLRGDRELARLAENIAELPVRLVFAAPEPFRRLILMGMEKASR